MTLVVGLIIPIMLHFNILPSPSPAVVISRYEKGAFPQFDPLFEDSSVSSPLHHLARDPQEASASVVLENRSEKPITAWRYRWQTLDVFGKRRADTCSKDSYAVDVYRAIAEPGSHHLISSTFGSVDETLINHVLTGGGLITMKVGAKSDPFFGDIVELTFEIQLVLFADGEIVGPDPDGYVTELICRKPAAEFIVRQVRLAKTEGRDVTPVLCALADTPSLRGPGRPQGDPLVHWTKRYAQDYLHNMHRQIGGVDMSEATLKHLENRPALPKLYRRQPPSE
jgi:hypothetical protein